MVIGAQPDISTRFLKLRAAKQLSNEAAHQRHPCLPANENDLIEIARLQLRIGQRAQAMATRAGDNVVGERFKLFARQFATETEIRRKEWQRDFNIRLDREPNLGLLGGLANTGKDVEFC